MSFGAMTLQASASLGALMAGLAVEDAVAVLHGGAGCDIKLHGLLHEHDPSGAVHRRLICTKIKEDQLVFDPGETLAQAITDMASRLDAKLAVISSATFIEISGLDRAHILDQLAEQVDIPAVYVYAPDVDGDLFIGYQRALAAIAERFASLAAPVHARARARRVNLVGYLLDRPFAEHRANLAALREILRALGLSLNLTLLDGSPTAALGRIAQAELNLVLPHGQAASAVLERVLDQPRLSVRPPMGLAGTAVFIRELAAAVGAEAKAEAFIAHHEARVRRLIRQACEPLVGRRVALFADGVRLAGLLEICRDLKMVPVLAGSLDERASLVDRARWPDLALVEGPSLNETARRLKAAVADDALELVIGSQFEVDIAQELGLRGLEFGFPCRRYQALVPAPYWGYDGVLTLAQRSLEALG